MDKVTLINKVVIESARMEENCTYSSKSHFNSSGIWSNIHFILGIILIIISAIPMFYGDMKFISLTIFILANIQTFIRPDKKACEHLKAGNDYLSLKNNIRQFSECRILNLETDVVLSELKNFTESLNYLNQTSPLPLNCGYKSAQKGIIEGQATFSVDKEGQ